MIDIDLTNKQADITNYGVLPNTMYPLLFLGFIIKNEYDNKRIQLNESFNPVQLLHIPNGKQNMDKDGKSFLGYALKGIILKPNENTTHLMHSVLKQEKIAINLVTYENLLNQYGFCCKETYNLFSKNFYPIDFENLKSVCSNDFKDDKKIFQHLLNLDEKSFDFQKFSALKLLVLTV